MRIAGSRAYLLTAPRIAVTLGLVARQLGGRLYLVPTRFTDILLAWGLHEYAVNIAHTQWDG